jgi:hypothetical protein
MRVFIRSAILLFLLITLTSISAYVFWYKPKFIVHKKSFRPPVNEFSESFAKLTLKVSALKEYIAVNHYNSRVCFLIDMKIPSGKPRFFVYDLQKDSVLISGLVAHGSCDNGFQMDAKFSNKVNCGCSCFGKFKVGKSYIGRFGLAYKLYGLDSSNNNAFERTIVLHSYKCVPEEEVYPLPICNSRGCPMVSPGFLQKLKLYIERSDKPILLTVFN